VGSAAVVALVGQARAEILGPALRPPQGIAAGSVWLAGQVAAADPDGVEQMDGAIAALGSDPVARLGVGLELADQDAVGRADECTEQMTDQGAMERLAGAAQSALDAAVAVQV
jgi:hypothetical protein